MDQIESEADVENYEIRKTKEFISWNQFVEYFNNYRRKAQGCPEKVKPRKRDVKIGQDYNEIVAEQHIID